MKVSCLPWLSLFIGLTACSGTSLTDNSNRLGPPSLSLQGISVDSGGVLKITVTVLNPTGVHLKLADAPQCPFDVRIFPDSTGQAMTGFGTILSTSCPTAASTTDLAPHDSLIVSRTFSPTDLTQYTPGLYGLNVTIGTTTTITTGWSGAVRLPLSSKP